jgi:hypothetical protein
MQTVSLKLTGQEKMFATLEALPKAVELRILRNAMRKALKPMEAGARGGVPRFSGLLERSIGVGRPKWYAHSGVMYLAVGPRSGFKKSVGYVEGSRGGRYKVLRSAKQKATAKDQRIQNPIKYAHLVEGGRRAVAATGKALYFYGMGLFRPRAASVAGRHFMARAWASASSAALSIMQAEIAVGVEREANKLSGQP